MSIVIVGGNECMECEYQSVCKAHGCKSKIFTKMKGSMKKKIGEPDLVVLFTNTVSHKMVSCALSGIDEATVKVVRSHSSSKSALKQILTEYAPL